MNLDTALLRSFTVLAEELHFARAAERLFIEQPALSQRIKRLEQRIGVELLTRDTRNVRLTPAGATFLKDAAEILDRIDNAVARAREAQKGSRGLVRIAYTLSVGYETLPLMLSAAHEHVPDIELEALEMWERDVLDAVRRRTMDIGAVRCDPPEDGLVSILIRREPLILAVPTGHHLAGREGVSVTELAGERFVITPATLAPGYQGLIDNIFSAAGFTPKTVANPVPGSRVMAVLSRNEAVSILPASAEQIHPSGVAAFIPITDGFARLPVRLVYREDAGPAVAALADTAQQYGRENGWL
ncbi:LysR family transcriptional regulator [Nocardia sp. NPDC003963]